MAILQYLLVEVIRGVDAPDYKDPASVQNYVSTQLYGPRDRTLDSVSEAPFRILGYWDWHLLLENPEGTGFLQPNQYIYPISVNDEAYNDFSAKISQNRLFEIGANPPINTADHWCPSASSDPIFGNRRLASQLIELDALPGDARGQEVNIVVIDRGLDKRHIPNFGGGWWRPGLPKPGTTVGGHGEMLLRSILDIAPYATIFDCPLLPLRISSMPMFLSDAIDAYRHMIHDIDQLRPNLRWQGPWIFLNAWAIYNREQEYPPGSYTNNIHHEFNKQVTRAVDDAIDVVFCAGNCGQFCPDSRCGPHDRGPGHSILGANSHPSVFTAAAVRADGRWLGYSSQGPGQPMLDPDKPDVCAPSHFCETRDSHLQNTGTSAASAILVGVIAALRSKWGPGVLSSYQLKQIIKRTAKKPGVGPQWKHRFGSGILDVNAVYTEILRRTSGFS